MYMYMYVVYISTTPLVCILREAYFIPNGTVVKETLSMHFSTDAVDEINKISQYEAWSLYKGAALWRAGSSTTKGLIGTVREGKGISSNFCVFISSRYDLSC